MSLTDKVCKFCDSYVEDGYHHQADPTNQKCLNIHTNSGNMKSSILWSPKSKHKILMSCPWKCPTDAMTPEELEAHLITVHNNRLPLIGSLKQEGNKLPEGQGKRDKIRPRYDLIPKEFLDELASIFEEGRKPRPGLPEGYGDSWKKGGEDFLRDCLNHAVDHLFHYLEGDTSENHLAKVAWNCLAVKWHRMKEESKNDQ